MVRLLAIALGCVCVLGAASPVLRVDENATRVVLRDGRSTVSLAVDNSGAPRHHRPLSRCFASAGGGRFGLVIGNCAYKGVPALANHPTTLKM